MNKVRLLLDMPVSGNIYEDRDIFSLANEILMGAEYSMSQKRMALRKIDEAMGLEGEDQTEEGVRQYQREWLEDHQ